MNEKGGKTGLKRYKKLGIQNKDAAVVGGSEESEGLGVRGKDGGW